MIITEQEARILRSCYKVLDYKLGNTDYQAEAKARQQEINNAIKQRQEQKILDRLRVVAHLKAGNEFEIDNKNPIEVELFISLKNEGLIELLEPTRNKYIAKWITS